MIELYDTVKLKDGVKCKIVEIIEQGKAYVGEVERKESVDGIEIEPVLQEDIIKGH